MSLLKSIIQKTSEKHPKIMDLRKGTKWASCQQSSCWYARNSSAKWNAIQITNCSTERPEAVPLGWRGSTELRMCRCVVGSPQTIPLPLLRDHLYISLLLMRVHSDGKMRGATQQSFYQFVRGLEHRWKAKRPKIRGEMSEWNALECPLFLLPSPVSSLEPC